MVVESDLTRLGPDPVRGPDGLDVDLAASAGVGRVEVVGGHPQKGALTVPRITAGEELVQCRQVTGGDRLDPEPPECHAGQRKHEGSRRIDTQLPDPPRAIVWIPQCEPAGCATAPTMVREMARSIRSSTSAWVLPGASFHAVRLRSRARRCVIGYA